MLLASVLLFTFSCKEKKEECDTDTAAEELILGTWELYSYSGGIAGAGPFFPADEGYTVTLHFRSDGTYQIDDSRTTNSVNGSYVLVSDFNAGCNTDLCVFIIQNNDGTLALDCDELMYAEAGVLDGFTYVYRR